MSALPSPAESTPPATLSAAGRRFALADATREPVPPMQGRRRGPFHADLAGAALRVVVDEAPPLWRLDLDDHGVFDFDASRDRVTLRRAGRDPERTRLALAGPVLLHALAQHAVFVLHASALAGGDGRAVALVGASGAGKSSLAAAARTQGWQALADDLLPFASRAADVVALPAFEQPKWSAAEQYPADAAAELPLAALVAVRRGAVAAFEPITPRAATELAVAMSVGTRVFPAAALGAHLAACAALGSAVADGRLRAGTLVVPERPEAIAAALAEALSCLRRALASG